MFVGLCFLAPALVLPLLPPVQPARCGYPRCCDGANAADDGEIQMEADGVPCSSGRIVTELVDASGSPLPDRFMLAVRACRGEFAPEDASIDTERGDDLITTALLEFPAVVRLRVVSRVLDDATADSLVDDVTRLVEAASNGEGSVSAKVRGGRRSVDLAMRVDDAKALAALRAALSEDSRVQMCF